MAKSIETRQVARTIAAHCVGARIRMLNRKISRVYDEAVRPFGIKFSQMNILTLVALGEPLAPSELVRMLELEKSTVSRNVALMQANGWIEITPHVGKGQLLRTTGAGRRLLKKAAPAWRQAQDRVESMLGSATAARLRDAADRLAGADG